MTSTPGGVIHALSASQAEEFDPEQAGGCPRRWYFHRIARLPLPEPERSKEDGDAGHALFATYYRGEALPRRARMLKAVRGALATGRLPAPEPGQLVESRFDGQSARDANGQRVPLDTARTLWLGAMPWDGYVDLRFYRAGMITVLDHKFSSDIHAYAKTDLLSTVQMPVYALDSLRIWPDAQHVELVHNYVSRRGVDSLYVRQLVTVAQVRQRGEKIEGLVKRMQEVARAPTADDVPANKKSCHTWSGCPFQSRCSAFKEKPKMDLNPEEMEWLNVVGGEAPAKPMTPGELAVAEAAGREDDAHGKSAAMGPDADRVTDLEIASAAGALDPADEDPFAVFAPQASVPQEQPAPPAVDSAKPADTAKCPECPHPAHPGAACTGKRGRGACRCGIGVMAAAVEQTPSAAIGTPGFTPSAEFVARVELPASFGHLATCVQNDAGKWLCMEGCTAALGGGDGVTLTTANPGKAPDVLADHTATASEALESLVARTNFQRDQPSAAGRAAEEHADDDLYSHLPPGVAELARVQDERRRSRGWTGTLQVNVNLGPETLALLQRLLGGR